MLAQLQCMEQMFIAVCEGRIHQDQAVAFAGMIIEKIIMNHPKTLANQDSTQVRIDFHAVDVVQIASAITVVPTAPVASKCVFNQITASSAGL